MSRTGIAARRRECQAGPTSYPTLATVADTLPVQNIRIDPNAGG